MLNAELWRRMMWERNGSSTGLNSSDRCLMCRINLTYPPKVTIKSPFCGRCKTNSPHWDREGGVGRGNFWSRHEREKAFPDCCQSNSSESLGSVRHFLEESNCTFPFFNTYPLWRTGDIDEKRHWMGKNSAPDNCFFCQGHWRRKGRLFVHPLKWPPFINLYIDMDSVWWELCCCWKVCLSVPSRDQDNYW